MKTLIANIFLLLSIAVAAIPSGAETIAVVMSSDAAAYQEALAGFRETVRHRVVVVQILKSDPAKWRDEVKKLRSVIEPDLVFVIGTPGLKAVAGEITNLPVVHALAFNPFGDASFGGKNVYGISMVPSPDQTISILKELNPKIHRVGTIHDPSRSGLLFSQARAVFQKHGVQLVSREIRSVSHIGAALKSLESNVEVLWLWPDDRFLQEEILQRIFLFSFERKIPVVGLSERHTDMGALLSLSYGSAKDMGKQAAELANEIFHNKAKAVSPIGARQFRLTVNFNSARKLDIEIPQAIISRADNVAKEPVYRNGDWWVFRTKTIDSNGPIKTEVHRVIYENGKLQSDDPSFFNGGDVSGNPFFLSFASVYLTDPERKWLDFPLIPGKKWSFSYARPNLHVGLMALHNRRADATAQVIGKVSHPIETPAGKFDAIEIWRTEYVSGRADLTYFYSPQSKSVVKLKAELSGYKTQQFELELIAYGNGGMMGKHIK